MLIAVDTNVLLDHAIGKEKIPDCLDVLRVRLKVDAFWVTPTVLQELAFWADNGPTESDRDYALKALTSMRHWGYDPVNLIPVGHGVVEQIALKLRMQNVIPQEEQNDSFIVAESALLGCAMLLSSDSHMLDAQENGKLNKILKECDVHLLTIASPSTIVSQFSLRH